LVWAAWTIFQEDPDAVIASLHADHAIHPARRFSDLIRDGAATARKTEALFTVAIPPTRPETGYGYIRPGNHLQGEGSVRAFSVDRFIEKPDYPTAKGYVEDGYLWNSGIFMMKASVWRRLLERFRPDISEAAGKAFDGGSRDGDFLRLDEDAFHACPSDSIDYAVMERLSGDAAQEDTPALVLPLDVGWSDVGAWSALWEVSERDEAGNVLEGDAFVHNARDNLLVAHHRMVAVVGVDNLIVVETPDAVLVADKGSSQDVKAVTQFLQREQRSEHRHHQRMHRPWGDFESIDNGERYQVKRLTVKPGESLSLQMHHHRAEHWIVVSGTAQVTNGDDTFLLTENQSTYIPVGATHRLENPGSLPLEIIEVQSGSYLGEDDIVRFEDIYNRAEGET
jgi:mannose-1-phosphate guanylyltransferase/mannose-6-phosphate isomerase